MAKRRLYTKNNFGIRAGIPASAKAPSACRIFRPGPDNNLEEVLQVVAQQAATSQQQKGEAK